LIYGKNSLSLKAGARIFRQNYKDWPAHVFLNYDRISRMAVFFNFKAGQTIYKASTMPDGAYIVHSGEVDLVSPGHMHLTTLHAGEIFGEIGQLLDERRTVNAIARTDCILTHVSSAVLTQKMEKVDPAIKGIIRALATRLTEANSTNEKIWSELQMYKSLT
jgi:CRP-like cAMP-binding protein